MEVYKANKYLGPLINPTLTIIVFFHFCKDACKDVRSLMEKKSDFI